MGVVHEGAKYLLKMFIAQAASTQCPSVLCQWNAGIGLATAVPHSIASTSPEEYVTYELRIGGTPTAQNYNDGFHNMGYERALIGQREIVGEQETQKLQKMETPFNVDNGARSQNNDILLMGENNSDLVGTAAHTGGWPWSPVKYFLLFNDTETPEYCEEHVDTCTITDSSSADYQQRKSSHLVVWGNLLDSTGQITTQGITVNAGSVPLFRKQNFKLTFTTETETITPSAGG